MQAQQTEQIFTSCKLRIFRAHFTSNSIDPLGEVVAFLQLFPSQVESIHLVRQLLLSHIEQPAKRTRPSSCCSPKASIRLPTSELQLHQDVVVQVKLLLNVVIIKCPSVFQLVRRCRDPEIRARCPRNRSWHRRRARARCPRNRSRHRKMRIYTCI